jgi:hypothetical protein
MGLSNKRVCSLNFLFAALAATIGLILISVPAFAGTVKEISSAKSQVTVELDEDAYKKGDELCIYNSKNKKIECGTVTIVRSTSVVVKLPSKKNIKKIKKGMQVSAEGASDKKSTATTKTTTRSAQNKDGFSLKLGWSPAIVSPSTFNSVGYLAPTSETPATLWEADEPVTETLLGAAMQVSFPVGSLAVMPGLRFRKFVPSRVDTNYFPKRLNPFVSSLTTGTAIGLFTDLRFLNGGVGSAFGYYASGGLDIEMSSLVFKSTKKDDSGGTPESNMASAESSLTVISLRGGVGLNLLPFKPFGATLGINLLLPLAEFGKKFSGSIEGAETKGLADPGGDLKTALGHKKNKFGADAQMSVLLAF